MKNKSVKIAFNFIVFLMVIASLFVYPGEFTKFKIYYAMIAGAWFLSVIVLLLFEEKEKASRWTSFLLGVMAAACFLPFSAWVVLSLVAKFGGQEWLVNYHLSREDFFPGNLLTAVSWPAMIAGGIFMLFSCILGGYQEKTANDESMANDLSARLKKVDDTEELNDNIHKLVEGKMIED